MFEGIRRLVAEFFRRRAVKKVRANGMRNRNLDLAAEALSDARWAEAEGSPQASALYREEASEWIREANRAVGFPDA